MVARIKAAVLLCLVSAAAYSVCGAYRSLQRPSANALPEELSLRFSAGEKAEYYLRDSGGYVAVFEDRRTKKPVTVTRIETRLLRDADRQLLTQGIPAADAAELLSLLEDLGS